MWNNPLGRHLRIGVGTVLLCGALLTICPLALFAVNARYLYNWALGPFPLDRDAVLVGDDPDQSWEYYCVVEGSSYEVGTEVSRLVRNDFTKAVVSERQQAAYCVMPLTDPAPGAAPKLLVIKAPPYATSRVYKGALVKLPSEVRRDIVEANERKVPELRDAHLRNVMLDARGFNTRGRLLVGAGGPALLIGLVCLGWGAWRLTHLEGHRSIVRLAKYGPLDEVVPDIAAELAAVGCTDLLATITATEHWLLIPRRFGLEVLPLTDLIWVYRQPVNFGSPGPVVTTDQLRVATRDGTLRSVVAPLPALDACLETIGRSAPWVILGYDPLVAEMWSQDPRRVCVLSDDRRRQS